MASTKSAVRALHFAVGGALLTAPLLVAGCDDKADRPTANDGKADPDDGKADDGKTDEDPEPVAPPVTNEGQVPDPEPADPPITNEGRVPDPEPDGVPDPPPELEINSNAGPQADKLEQ